MQILPVERGKPDLNPHSVKVLTDRDKVGDIQGNKADSIAQDSPQDSIIIGTQEHKGRFGDAPDQGIEGHGSEVFHPGQRAVLGPCQNRNKEQDGTHPDGGLQMRCMQGILRQIGRYGQNDHRDNQTGHDGESIGKDIDAGYPFLMALPVFRDVFRGRHSQARGPKDDEHVDGGAHHAKLPILLL